MNTNSKNNFVFIVGCPRSGTYLLSLFLYSRFQVAVPVETHFIPLFKRFLPLWGDLKKYENRRRLLNAIFDFLEIWMVSSGRGRSFEKLSEYSLLSVRENDRKILESSCSYAEIVENIFKEYAEKMGSPFYGDKSVFLTHIPLELLGESVLNPKIIHIVRDGRDVCLSWLKTWFGPHTYVESAALWADHVVRNRRWGRKNSENYLEIRFEELLEKPEAVLANIGSFLSIPDSGNSRRHWKSELAQILSEGEHHKFLSKQPDQSNTGKWRREMSLKNRQIFEFVAGNVLSTLGYDRASNDFVKGRKIRLLFYIYFCRFMERLSVRRLRVRIKNCLPVALFICSVFKINLNGMITGGRETDRKNDDGQL